MKKFKFLTLYNLKKAVFTKSFVISNIVIFLIIVLLMSLPRIIGSVSEDVETVNVIVYYDSYDNDTHKEITTYFEQSFSTESLESIGLVNIKYNISVASEILTEANIDVILEQFKNSDKAALIWFQNCNDINMLEAGVKYNKISLSAQNFLESTTANTRISLLNVELPQPIPVEPIIKNGDQGMDEETMGIMMIIAQVISLPMLFIIIRALVLVGVDIVQEKSSKAIETIISSVPAKIHFFSKVLASLGFVLIQSVLLLIFSAIGGLFSGSEGTGEILSFLEISVSDIIILLLITFAFTIISSLFYLMVGGILAAMSNSQEDYQVFQGPLTLFLLLGFYFNLFLPSAGQTGLNILRIISFIPPFSGFTAPVAFALGAMLWWEALISFIIFIVVIGVVLYFFAPVYRVSILNYEQTKFFKRIISNFKKARIERRTKT